MGTIRHMETRLRRSEPIAPKMQQPAPDPPTGEPDDRGPQPATPAGAASRWTETDEDVRLMLAFQAGDESAFAKIVEHNQARVYGVVHRFCAGRGDVEDIVQEVFLRVFRSASRYTPTAKFSTWLYRIAANLSLSALRSAGKLKTTTLRIAGPSGESDQRDRELEDANAVAPDEAIQVAELAEQVREAVEQLPESQRIAIILSRYEDMPYEHIAEVMECSTMAVKSLLSRARTNLRRALARHLRP